LNVDINHIGVQQMTKSKSPFAALLAAALVVSLWAPTLAMPEARAASLLVPSLA
jgi:hypothetical protein